MVTRTERGLLDAIIAAPGDDFLRLVYADWCEENGQDLRAEFIRLQLQIAAIGEKCTRDDGGAPSCRPGLHHGCDRRRAEWRLLEMWTPGNAERAVGVPTYVDGRLGRLFVVQAVAERGFAVKASCTLAAWLAHGPGVASRHPLELGAEVPTNVICADSDFERRHFMFVAAVGDDDCGLTATVVVSNGRRRYSDNSRGLHMGSPGPRKLRKALADHASGVLMKVGQWWPVDMGEWRKGLSAALVSWARAEARRLEKVGAGT